MEKSTKMVAALVLAAVLAAATSGAEARDIKTTAEAASKDAVLQPTTFPPFDRLGSASPAFGGLPGSSGGGSGGSSGVPGFRLPGSGSGSGTRPGFGGIGSMPFLGGGSPGSPGFGGFGGMPGSPAAGAVSEHAQKP